MSRKIMLSLAALLCTNVPVSAADMQPVAIADVSAPAAFRPSRGWYLLGSISYVASKPVYDFTLDGDMSESRRFGYSVGSGYRFNDRFRADMTSSYIERDRFGGGGADAAGRYEMWSILLNGYVGLGTYGDFTPYVGAGAGMLRTSDTMRASFPGSAPDFDPTQTEFAYSLNAGVGYRMSDSLTLDLGYQFLASPKTQYLDFDALAVDEGVQLHQIKIGLRYSLH